MPISQLVTRLDPAPPDPVMAAAEALRHRSLISVGLILDRDGVFPDQWIYVHSPEVRVGRIQNFANWSADLVARPGTSHLGLEYFCDEDDELWRLPDAELIRLASRELARLGLAARTTVVDGMVIRQAKAYPLYDAGFDHNLRTLRRFLAGFSNLRTIGRNGMHRYNNMDHAMLTGAAAVASLAGEDADPWAVNTERSYHESGKVRPR